MVSVLVQAAYVTMAGKEKTAQSTIVIMWKIVLVGVNALVQDNASVNQDGLEEPVAEVIAPDLTIVPCVLPKQDVAGVMLSRNVYQALVMVQISKAVQLGFTINVQQLDPTLAVQNTSSQSNVSCATATKSIQMQI